MRATCARNQNRGQMKVQSVQSRGFWSLVCLLSLDMEGGCGGDIPVVTETDFNNESEEPGQVFPTTGEACEFEDYNPGVYSVRCENAGVVDPASMLTVKNTASIGPGSGTAGEGEYYMPYVDACADIDPQGDPEILDSGIRAACTIVCGDVGFLPKICLDSRWSSVSMKWKAPCQAQTCPNASQLLDFDLIEDFLGPAAAEDAMDLPCDLPFDCIEYLSALEISGMYTEPTVNLGETASIQLVANSEKTGMRILGFNQSPPGTGVPLSGYASLTATSCGADACPFYLAQFDLAASSPFAVTLDYSSTTITKTLAGFTIGLDHPALGLWLPATGDVIFPTNSLVVRVGAVISGAPEYFSENGSYDERYPWSGYVFGTFDPGSGEFAIEASGDSLLGSWDLGGQFLP